MTTNDFNIALSSAFKLNPISANEYEIKTTGTFPTGEELKIYLVKEGDSWFLTDKKNTLKYMNNVYDLKATDVKSCISAVIKIYGFTITAGNLRAEIIDEVDFSSKILDYIMCIGQLTNMYVFFDQPE